MGRINTAKSAVGIPNIFFAFSHSQIAHLIIRRSTTHHGVRKRGGDARGGAGAHACRLYPAAVRTQTSFPRQRTPTFRARRILFTSCQSARASAHRAVHLDGPGTKARACSARHAKAQAVGGGIEQRVYTCGRRSRSQSICSPQVRASLVLPCLRFLLPFCGERAEQLTLFDANLKTQ